MAWHLRHRAAASDDARDARQKDPDMSTLLLSLATALVPALRTQPRCSVLMSSSLDASRAQVAGFWEARSAAAKHQGARTTNLLQELQLRENLMLEQLAEQRQRTRDLEAQLQGGGAPIASTPPSASTEQGELAEALEEARRALEEAALQRELDLQKTSAFWLDKLTAARAVAVAPASAEVAVPAAAPASDSSVHDEIAQLRWQHKQELEAAALRAERQLQTAAAFWVERAARAGASDARITELEAQLAAQTELAETRMASNAALAAALEARELRAERELQATAAFWLARLQESKAQGAAAESAATEPTKELPAVELAAEENRLRIALLRARASRGALAETMLLQRAVDAAATAGLPGDGETMRDALALLAAAGAA